MKANLLPWFFTSYSQCTYSEPSGTSLAKFWIP